MSTLIVYSGKYGCTSKCVSLLEEGLSGTVKSVNLKTDPLPDLNDFDKVIIGGSIYIGRIHKTCKQFCIDHLDTLKTKTVGLFICCGDAEQINLYADSAFPSVLREHAVTLSCFGGEFQLDSMKWLDKLMIKAVIKSNAKQGKPIPRILEENIRTFAEAMNIA